MSAKVAVRLCPHAVFVRPRIDYYAKVSKTIHAILESFTPMIEPLSLDEAFSRCQRHRNASWSCVSIARKIKRRIADEVGLIASVGVAPNKFLAKIASDLEKPNGLVVVDPNRIQEFWIHFPSPNLGCWESDVEGFRADGGDQDWATATAYRSKVSSHVREFWRTLLATGAWPRCSIGCTRSRSQIDIE